MKATEHPHGLVLSDIDAGSDRSTGLHMSDLYGSLYKDLQPKRYNKKTAEGLPEEMDWNKVFAGLAFERQLEPLLRKLCDGERPGELFTQHDPSCSAFDTRVKDGSVICHCGAGVAYSPDWLFFSPEGDVLGEFKFTWYSLRDFPHHEKFDKWLCQVKCYLKHLKLQKRTVRVYPYWVVGGYPKGAPPTPVFTSYYELVFTQRELDHEWEILVEHGRKVGMIP